MKNLKKKMLALVLMGVMTLTNTFVVSAAVPQEEAVYDLEKGGTQTFIIKDDDGEIQTITIEEVESNARVADNTYKITYETGNWIAGYYIKVANNQITSAYSPFYTALHGSIKDATLVRNSNVKVSYLFVFQITLLKFSTGVITTISNSEIIVSKK